MSGNLSTVDDSEDLWGTGGLTKGRFCFTGKTSAEVLEIFCEWCRLKRNILEENFPESESIYENA